MGFFSTILYSQEEHPLTEFEVRKFVTYLHVPTLEHHLEREKMVQDAILARRHSDGKISLQQIYETLTHMKDTNQITKYDREGIMKVLKQYLSTRTQVETS